MVAPLEIWYNQRTANDYGQGDPAIIVKTAEELDAFIDRVLADTRDTAVPSMVEISVVDDPMRGVLEAGLGQERGFIYFMVPETVWTKGDATFTGTVTYDYARHVREIPASAEVPIDVVRQGLREFLETGIRPTSVEWEQAE